MPGGGWKCASPSDFDRWEALIADGTPAFEAARELGFTTSAFKRGDATRHAEAIQAARDIAAGEDREYVRDRLRENVERSMQQIPVRDHEGNETGEWRYDGQVANRSLELLGKQAGMFSDTVQVDVEHGGDVKFEFDHSRILGQLTELGLLGPHQPGDAEALEILPAPSD